MGTKKGMKRKTARRAYEKTARSGTIQKTFMQRYKIASPKQKKIMRLQRNAPSWAKLLK